MSSKRNKKGKRSGGASSGGASGGFAFGAGASRGGLAIGTLKHDDGLKKMMPILQAAAGTDHPPMEHVETIRFAMYLRISITRRRKM